MRAFWFRLDPDEEFFLERVAAAGTAALLLEMMA